MLYDFHCHTYLSDGELSPVELIRTACVQGYTALAITDHAGIGFLADRLRELRRDVDLATRYWPIEVVVGVELTHLPPEAIAEAAATARAGGAQLVVVHGETIVEPVPPGTNLAAVRCADVDVLGHPGLLSAEEARIAAANGVFVEISARRGHSLSNGRVAQYCLEAGARLIVDSDGHAPEDLLTEAHARRLALGAGVPEQLLPRILVEHPQQLLAQLRR
ncbi:MAG TPA: histidinol phosphate phosphatase domain-containing protein [Chloroflexota bacterium]|nr:histidinol phosphate phosphatase domain-containing protein [Chloroflexota bacterium]